MSNTNPKTKKSPVAKIRVGSVTASIWENTNEKGTQTTVTFQRSYKNAEGKWHNREDYRGTALLELSKAALDAHDRLREATNGNGE